MHYCSQEMKLLLYCSQEKDSGALLFSGNETVALLFFRRSEQVHFCSQEMKLLQLLFLGEGNRCTTVLKENETVVLLFLGEGNRCTTVLRK